MINMVEMNMNVKKVHMIGIGGIGTSAAAKYFLAQGAEVSGSDMYESAILDDLRSRGAVISIGHAPENISEGVELIVHTPAAKEENVERLEAKNRNIRDVSYPEFLGELAKTKKTIAVSGTNGKSTTTAMIAKILIEAGYDPLVFLATQSSHLSDGNFNDGKGIWMIVEACEYQDGMLNIIPNIAVITNIEADHLDYFRDIAHIEESFQKWVSTVHPFEGTVVLNAQDISSQNISAENTMKFSFEHRSSGAGIQSFKVKSEGQFSENASIQLLIPGAFNAANASAAFSAAKAAGVNTNIIKDALKTFKGTWRRFEHVGAWKGAEIYSDYAHHPTAVKGAVEAFKEFYPKKRLIIVFEPHQHSRTKELFDEFIASFSDVDILILSEIYKVEGRTEDDSVTSEELAVAVKKTFAEKQVEYAANQKAAEEKLESIAQEGDVIVIMGAGPIDALARELVSL